MDPRVGTYFPESVKASIKELLDDWPEGRVDEKIDATVQKLAEPGLTFCHSSTCAAELPRETRAATQKSEFAAPVESVPL